MVSCHSPAPVGQEVLAESRAHKWSDAALLLLLGLASVAVYANTLGNGFVYDDHEQVLHNPYLRSFRYLPDILTSNVWAHLGAQGESNYYRPVMTLGYLLCYQAFGDLAYIFHLYNIVFNTAVVMVLFFLSLRMFGRKDLAFWAALVFALHPVHTESVAWIAAITDVEMALFYLLAFYLFVRLSEVDPRKMSRYRLGMVVSFVLALFSKEPALTLPLLATVYEHWFRPDRERTPWRVKWGRYGLLWLLALAYIPFRVRMLGAFAPQIQMSTLSIYETLLSAIALVGRYIELLFFPVQLVAFHVFRKSESWMNPEVLQGAGLILIVAMGFLYFFRKNRTLAFSFVWFFATLSPMLNAKWMAANVFTERYLYLPSVGFCWLAGSLMAHLTREGAREQRARTLAAWTGIGIILILFFIRTVIRNRDWNNDIVLYTKVLAVYPDASHIHNNLGTVYWMNGSVKEAEREFLAAEKLVPENAIYVNNLGLVYAHQERYEEALKKYQVSLLAKPHYAEAHLNMGDALRKMDRLPEAEIQYRAAVALSPLKARARNQLGELYQEQQRFDEAEQQYRESIEGELSQVPFDGLGEICFERGDLSSAEEFFRQALAIYPSDSRAHLGLGKIFLRRGLREEAQREFEQTLLTDPENEVAISELERLATMQNRTEIWKRSHAVDD